MNSINPYLSRTPPHLALVVPLSLLEKVFQLPRQRLHPAPMIMPDRVGKELTTLSGRFTNLLPPVVADEIARELAKAALTMCGLKWQNVGPH